MVVCIFDSLSAFSGDGHLLTDPPPRLGWTPFHAACTFNQPDCAGALALAGCDVGVKDRKTGLTGRQIAEKEGHTAVVERLRAVVAEQLRAAQAVGPEPEPAGAGPAAGGAPLRRRSCSIRRARATGRRSGVSWGVGTRHY